MRHRVILSKLLLAGILSLLVPDHVVFGQGSPAHKEIEEIYAKRSKAIRNKDFAFLKTHQANDYTEKSEDGTIMNRQQADAEADEVFATVKEVHECSTKVDSIKPGKEKDVLIVEVSDTGKMSFLGPDGKVHEISARGRSRDVWKLYRQGWLIQQHETLESQIEVDGTRIK